MTREKEPDAFNHGKQFLNASETIDCLLTLIKPLRMFFF